MVAGVPWPWRVTAARPSGVQREHREAPAFLRAITLCVGGWKHRMGRAIGLYVPFIRRAILCAHFQSQLRTKHVCSAQSKLSNCWLRGQAWGLLAKHIQSKFWKCSLQKSSNAVTNFLIASAVCFCWDAVSQILSTCWQCMGPNIRSCSSV